MSLCNRTRRVVPANNDARSFWPHPADRLEVLTMSRSSGSDPLVVVGTEELPAFNDQSRMRLEAPETAAVPSAFGGTRTTNSGRGAASRAGCCASEIMGLEGGTTTYPPGTLVAG